METGTGLGSGKRFGKMEEGQTIQRKEGHISRKSPFTPEARKAQELGEPGSAGGGDEAGELTQSLCCGVS